MPVVENPRSLAWTDAQGDRFQIEAEATTADYTVLAGILVGDAKDGEEAAVWVTEKDAQRLVAWLTERLANS